MINPIMLSFSANLTCVQDTLDIRDYIYTPAKKPLSESVVLSNGMSAPILQGELNSCSAIAISSMIEYDLRKENDPIEGTETLPESFLPSQLFLYYNERVLEGKIDINAPVQIRNGIKSAVKTGVCSYNIWPYDPNKFKEKPPDIAYRIAKSCTAISYYKINKNLDDLRACINERFPFIFGFFMPSSFAQGECAKTGIMTLPPEDEERKGGHAVAAFGYDDKKECFYIRNSWSSYWGDKGYFYMPYKFITGEFVKGDTKTENTFSFWTIRRMT